MADVKVEPIEVLFIICNDVAYNEEIRTFVSNDCAMCYVPFGFSMLRHHLMYLNVCWIITISLLSCVHKHEVSADVLAAIEIQQEGIELSHQLDSMLVRIDDEVIRNHFSQRNLWLLSQMIIIEGAAHDHEACQHSHTKLQYDITNEEMISVQSVWRDSVFSLLQQVSYVLQ